MEQQQEKVNTEIAVEEQAAPAKKKPGWRVIVLGTVLLLIAVWGSFRAFQKPQMPSHQPTAEELEQLKYDSDEKDRELKKASQLRDQALLVRKEDDSQAQVNGLLRDLNLKKDATPLPDQQAKSEEEAISHVLRSSPPTRTPAKNSNNETPRRTAPSSPTASADSPSMTPMFVYSRIFGGAKYLDAPQKQSSQPAPSSTKTAKPDAEKSPKVEPGSGQNAKLIYTDYPPVTLYEGEMLEAVLVNRIIADTEPSPVICNLSRDLFDQSARYVVLPANSRIIGNSQVVNYKGAHRLFVNFNRIILPNGPSIDLPSSQKALKALDETGALGVVSKVERHWFLQFGTSIFFGVLDGLAGIAQRNQDVFSTRAVVLGRTSENFGRILENVMAQYSTIVPTIRVDQGKTMRIYLSDDIVISPYAKIADRSYYASR
jgi:type IV secretion system protein VirB10